MKSTLIMCLVLLITISAQSQKKTFIRIFNETGKKTYKGFLMAASDSSLTILNGEKTSEIPVSQITTIKLRRSFGHTVLVTTLILGTSIAILGIATADPSAGFIAYTAGEGALAGLAFGGGLGVVTGSIIASLRDRPAFKVNMKQEQWMKVKGLLKKYLPATMNK